MIPIFLFTRRSSGYIPGAEGLSAVAALARKLRREKSDFIYLLDRTCPNVTAFDPYTTSNSRYGGRGSPLRCSGRHTRIPNDATPRHDDHSQLVRSRVMPDPSSLSPPHHSLVHCRTLTQIELTDFASLQRALNCLHENYHVPHVVITSIPLQPWLLAALPQNIKPVSGSDHLLCISSSSSRGSTTPSIVHAQCVPLIPGYFSGVGDLFSALLLAHFRPTHAKSDDQDLSRATSQALTKTHAVLLRTHEYAVGLPEEDRQASDDEKDRANPTRKTKRMRGRELRLVQSQDIIRGIGQTEERQMIPWTSFWHNTNWSACDISN